MPIAKDFIDKLQEATGAAPFVKKFWEDFSSASVIPTFQDVLNKYADYYSNSNLSDTQKTQLTDIFWNQIKAYGGTPIIENTLGSNDICNVYFLIKKDSLQESKEVPGTKMDLYLQGDFHSYGSIDGRQKLLELENTGIMLRTDRIAKASILTYQYIQTEPSHQGKTITQKFVPFFKDSETETLLESEYPGEILKNTLPEETLQSFNNDPNTALPGMGVRLIDYSYGINQYANFIGNTLFPELKKQGIDIPENPRQRIMIGSSLSGTASIYIGINYPKLFGAIIAQSPSPANRDILRERLESNSSASISSPHIHLSCGVFEQPGFADNTNLAYAIHLSRKLNTPLKQGLHGHQFIPWIETLDDGIPALTSRLTQQFKSNLEDIKLNGDISSSLADEHTKKIK